jgi:hypothetical protein
MMVVIMVVATAVVTSAAVIIAVVVAGIAIVIVTAVIGSPSCKTRADRATTQPQGNKQGYPITKLHLLT